MDARQWKAKGETFNVEGRRIYYWDEGEGPVLVLVHGFPTSSWDWAPMWPDLIANWRVIVLDLLGYGFSDKPTDCGYETAIQTDIYEALLDHLGIDTFTLFSHDYGDTVAQELILRHNQRTAKNEAKYTIHSWCLLNGGMFIEAAKPRPIQKLLLNPMTGPLVSALLSKRRFSKSFSAVFAPDKQPSPDELNDFWWIISTNGGHRIAHKLGQYLGERHRRRDEWVGAMQQTHVPMRFICGMLDPVSGANMAERYMEIIPNPDLVELPDVGHYPQVEAPKRVLSAFESFANKHLPK